jgi:hypothetical protein
MAGLQRTSVNGMDGFANVSRPMVNKLGELPFVEQMNTYETIFSR